MSADASDRLTHVSGGGRYGAISLYWLEIITRVGDLRVYLAIAAHAREGRCWPARATLAELLKMTGPAVSRAIVRLEQIGALRVDRRAGLNSHYELVSPAVAILRNAKKAGVKVERAGDGYRFVNCPKDRFEAACAAWIALGDKQALEAFRNES